MSSKGARQDRGRRGAQPTTATLRIRNHGNRTPHPFRLPRELWVVRIEGDDGELQLWYYIYEGRRGRWGTSTLTLYEDIQRSALRYQCPNKAQERKRPAPRASCATTTLESS